MSLSTNPLANSNAATPTAWDLVEPTWMAEVQGQYHAALGVNRTVRKEQIATGREAKFQLTGKLGHYRHNAGDEVRGLPREQMSRSIFLYDRPEVSAVEYEDLVPLVEQVNTRGLYTVEMAYALAQYTEIETMKLIALAARTTKPTNVTDNGAFFGGFSSDGSWNGDGITGIYGNNAAGAREFLAAIKSYVVGLENANIPALGLMAFTTPALWYEIRQIDGIVAPSTSVEGTAGAVGIFNDTRVTPNPIHFSQYLGMEAPLEYMGVKIYRHSLFGSDSVDGEYFAKDRSTDDESAGDFSNVKGLIYNGGCIGFVDKFGPTMETNWDFRTKTWMTDSRVWLGGGTLRPELSCVLQTS